jgi:hypothetical protein
MTAYMESGSDQTNGSDQLNGIGISPGFYPTHVKTDVMLSFTPRAVKMCRSLGP